MCKTEKVREKRSQGSDLCSFGDRKNEIRRKESGKNTSRKRFNREE